jgi:hypothetical protein
MCARGIHLAVTYMCAGGIRLAVMYMCARGFPSCSHVHVC